MQPRTPAPPSSQDLDAELAIRSLAEFVRQAWTIIEPGTALLWNWHLDVMCDSLERQVMGDSNYRKLLFTVPPGTMKSLLVSVFAPAWEWLHFPERRKLFFANDDTLAVRDSRREREVITSDWYRALVTIVERRRGREPWTLAHDQNEKINFANTLHGVRQCLSVGAKVTGKRADAICIDDPLDAKEVVNGSMEQVAARLEVVNNVIEKVLPSRVNNLAEARWTIIMQRLHDDDPAGRAIAEGDWRVVNLQMEFEPANPMNHPDDQRTDEGELLFPALFPSAELDKVKKKLGPRHYSSQYQQHPMPGEGGPLKRWYWCFWFPPHMNTQPKPVLVRKPDGSMHECPQRALPEALTGHTQSWDMAFKDTQDSAYVVGQLWAGYGADSFLLDQLRDKLDIVATIEAVRLLSKRWPDALRKLVEDKANGPAVIGMLRRELAGLTEVQPQGGKEARANAAAPAIESQNVWIPHPSLAPWVNDFLAETEAFPAGKYADQVDACTQYLNHRYSAGQNVLEKLSQL